MSATDAPSGDAPVARGGGDGAEHESAPSQASSPKRIQLRRTKGWRKPKGAVVVDRRTAYGNPWRMQDVDEFNPPYPKTKTERDTRRRAWAVRQYARELKERGGTGEFEFVTTDQIRERLCGKDLACWCPLDQPCHADVLLEVANDVAPNPKEDDA